MQHIDRGFEIAAFDSRSSRSQQFFDQAMDSRYPWFTANEREPNSRILALCEKGVTVQKALETWFPDQEYTEMNEEQLQLYHIRLAQIQRSESQSEFSKNQTDTDRLYMLELPFADQAFHVVFCFLFFHRLMDDEKLEVLDDCFRVLLPGGELYIVDWGAPKTLYEQFAFLPVRLSSGFAQTRLQVKGGFSQLLSQVFFTDVQELARKQTSKGQLTCYYAKKPM